MLSKKDALNIYFGHDPMMFIKNFKGSNNYTVFYTSNYNGSYIDINLGDYNNAVDAIECRDEFIKEWFGYYPDYILNKESDIEIPAIRVGSILINSLGDVFTRTGKKPSRITRGSFDGFETRLKGKNKVRIQYAWVPHLMDGKGIEYYCKRTGLKFLTPIENTFILTKIPVDGFIYYKQERIK